MTTLDWNWNFTFVHRIYTALYRIPSKKYGIHPRNGMSSKLTIQSVGWMEMLNKTVVSDGDMLLS